MSMEGSDSEGAEEVSPATVLLVDDNAEARSALRRTLEWHGYAVVDTSEPEEAFAHARERTIDLLLTDIVMPKMSGLSLARKVVELQPGTKVLFISGYADGEVPRSIPGVVTGFLEKPMTIGQVTGKVRELLDLPKA
jgi:two-component system, cell cycle sensor histidine kinase and response regulator CckA